MNPAWFAVSGFGAHIKSTPSKLVVQRGGNTQQIPLDTLDHLLIIGGHTLHTSAVTHLLHADVAITFFGADGTAVGFLHPYGFKKDENMRRLQESAGAHTYAVIIAQSSLKARILQIETISDDLGTDILYEGELEFLHSSLREIEYLITLDEIRRLHILTRDMYYEIRARALPPDLGFRRLTTRPHIDPVNAMLAYGYAILFGNCLISVIGSDLDPDIGMLHDGKGALVHDLIEPLKIRMVDECVFTLARAGISPAEYECNTSRCYLNKDLTDRLSGLLHRQIRQDVIDKTVTLFCDALASQCAFYIPY